MVKVGVIGRGRLGSIIIQAIEEGKAPECELVGVASRTEGVSVEDLLEKGTEIIIEAANQDVLKQELIRILEAGVSVIPLSAGVFADAEFTGLVEKTAREHHAKVYLPHGAAGAFDLAATYSLGDKMHGAITQISAAGGKGAPSGRLPAEYRGPALEGYALNPGHLNVVVETMIACGGPDQTEFVKTVAERGGWKVSLQNEYAEAELVMHGRGGSPFMMIALSAVSMLNRITSPITF